MKILIDRTGESVLYFKAKNSQGGSLDLTGLGVTWRLKANPSSATTLISKENTEDGGSDSEIYCNDASGLVTVFLSQSDKSNLSERTYYFEVDIESENIISGFLIIKQGVGLPTSPLTIGTTAQRPTLTVANEGFQYYDTTIKAPIWWDGTSWSDNL